MTARALFLPEFDTMRAQVLSRCEIRPGLPSALTLDEPLLTPASVLGHDEEGQPEIEGALFDTHGERVEGAALVRDHRRLNGGEPAREAKRLEGCGIYLGWLIPAYGHALLEGLARAWALSDPALGSFDFAVYHAPYPSKEPPRYLRFHLERLGGPPVRIPTQPTRFERLVVPEAAFEIKTRAYRGFIKAFGRARGSDPTPVYVSRSRLAAEQRPLAGEDVLEAALRRDYRVIHPEAMSVEEQVGVFHRHHTFAGALGSGMHNILFTESPRVTYLAPETPNPNFLMCDELVEADSLYVGCCDEGGLRPLGPHTPLRLDVARAGEALGVSIAAALQDSVDSRHRELWSQARLREGVVSEYDEAVEEILELYDHSLPSALTELAQRLDPRRRLAGPLSRPRLAGPGATGQEGEGQESDDAADPESRISRVREELERERRRRRAVEASLSWRVTRPLRRLRAALSRRR